MWIIDVPLELVPENNVTDSNVELDNFEKLTLHLLVLSKLMNLFFHWGYNLILKNGG